MARLPYLEPDQVAPEYRDMLARNTNLHKLLVNSPDMARAFSGLGGYIRHKSKLNPRLRELAILQVGCLEKSEYEFTHHVKIGKEFGVTDEDIAALMIETEGMQSRLEPLARSSWLATGQAAANRSRCSSQGFRSGSPLSGPIAARCAGRCNGMASSPPDCQTRPRSPSWPAKPAPPVRPASPST